MDDKKKEEKTVVSTDTTAEATTPESHSSQVVTELVEATENNVEENLEVTTVETVVEEKIPTHRSFNLKAYVTVVVIILVISSGLLFVLEKEGRISTGLFTSLISSMEARSPAARVNGKIISKKDFNSSLQQLNDMAAGQGADASDPALIEKNRTQAIETLVNAELLRQSAIAEGMTVTPEEIEGRYTEIQDGIGGAEKLAARMAEFGVTEESLRRDIENEFLIQGLFDVKISSNSIEVSEDEISTVYKNASAAGKLPPLKDVREQIVAQVKFEKEQTLINEYLETLKKDAKIEILI